MWLVWNGSQVTQAISSSSLRICSGMSERTRPPEKYTRLDGFLALALEEADGAERNSRARWMSERRPASTMPGSFCSMSSHGRWPDRSRRRW